MPSQLEKDKDELAATEALLAAREWSTQTNEQRMAENRIAVLKEQIAIAEATIAGTAAAQAEHVRKVSRYPHAQRVQQDEAKIAALKAKIAADIA